MKKFDSSTLIEELEVIARTPQCLYVPYTQRCEDSEWNESRITQRFTSWSQCAEEQGMNECATGEGGAIEPFFKCPLLPCWRGST